MGYFKPVKNPTSFRKLAASMWKPPNDPHIFGSLDVDMTDSLAFLDDYNKASENKVTVTHLVARALALTLARYPEYNAKVSWRRILMRPSVDVFCQVATDSGRDLSGKKISSVDQLTIDELAGKLTSSARAIRNDEDPDFKRSRALFWLLPLWALRVVLKVMSFLSNTLNLHLPKLGMPRDPFGSAMVTSVGMFDIDTGYAPFTPIARCPIVLTVTKIRPRPWVIEDRVVARPVLRLCGAFDHRVIDGFSAGRLSTEMEHLLYNPKELLTESERAAAA
jgi:pyruvate dehydrogenase E2 component (dihydrolipoamide acetyltransferase)